MSAVRIVAIFNLKPEVDAARYEAWAREIDLPTVNGLASIAKFEVFKAVSVLGSDAAPPYQYVEIIDIADMAGFERDVASDTMQKIASTFQGMADVTFLITEKVG